MGQNTLADDIAGKSQLTKHQVDKKVKMFKEDGKGYRIIANIRYDDNCGNGHNSFSITGEIWRQGNQRDCESCGCIHDEIAKHFPELKPYLKWHLMSSDGPMYYIANTIYHASDTDCWGKYKGEPRSFKNVIKFGKNPIIIDMPKKFVRWLMDKDYEQMNKTDYPYKPLDTRFDFEVIELQHKDEKGGYKFSPKYTFGGFADKWHECPFDTEQEALGFLYALQNCEPVFDLIVDSWGEGKESDLEAARNSAIWPDATLEQLQDEKQLQDRLPALIAEFKKDVESLGFKF